MVRLSVGALLLVLLPAAFARTVYIRDDLYVPLRGGQSGEHRILHRGVRSGTPLELLEQNDATEYSRVRMPDGLEGWIQTQYLVDEPIARDLLEGAQAELRALQATHQQTLIRLADAEALAKDLTTRYDATQLQLEQANEELDQIRALAANVIQIDEQNAALASERESLEQQIDELMVANDRLTDSAAREWFVRGGAVVLVALLIGLWIGRRIYHNRSTGWIQ